MVFGPSPAFARNLLVAFVLSGALAVALFALGGVSLLAPWVDLTGYHGPAYQASIHRWHDAHRHHRSADLRKAVVPPVGSDHVVASLGAPVVADHPPSPGATREVIGDKALSCVAEAEVEDHGVRKQAESGVDARESVAGDVDLVTREGEDFGE